MKKKTKRRWANYFIELLIVIIGITIAFWFNNLADTIKNRKQKIAYLTDIKNDLKTDSLKLVNNIKNNEIKSETLYRSLELIKRTAPIDSVLSHILEIGSYDFFKPDNFTLTSLLQSGDLKLIDSEQTKRELMRLLQMYESIDNMQINFLQALDENYFPMLISKVDMTELRTTDPDYFYGIEIKNYCAYTLNETDRHIKNYKYAQNQVNNVMKLIKDELSR
ncbi:hypothetical protein GWK08_16600 [Leptobacterium flavescens]|uniref:Uncharacterized protein n=1 Tax=Leptobacterium flavescens TaxID=472055 RepID=A0A6P0UX91_9FLAO|nr:DUF6090 family protein [Leptobacterium flavescens]NER15076.1 hypothetical protein [Leptobacterium flavescens]